MKKTVVILLALALCLALCACSSEEQQLYEKYASIIDQLENKNYSGAMAEITQMAIAEQQGNVEKIPAMQILCDNWYARPSSEKEIPLELEFREDGTCTIAGESLTWVSRDESETHLSAWIMEEGNYRYALHVNTSGDNAIPRVALSYVEEYDGGVQSGSHIANYYNHSLIPYLLASWYSVNRFQPATDDFHVNSSEVQVDGNYLKWSLTEETTGDSLTLKAEAKSGSEGAYTMTMSMRGEYPVMTVTNDATGESGLYYHSGYGKDETWVEARYAVAMRALNNFMQDDSFSIGDAYYSTDNSNSLSVLYDLFAELGDYADAPQLLENWDSVRYHWAMRFLDRYEKNGSFYLDGESYKENSARTYLYHQFDQLRGYEDTDTILARFTILPQMYTKAVMDKVDNLGNARSETMWSYQYDSNGNIVYSDEHYNYQCLTDALDYSPVQTYRETGRLYYTYDDKGVLTEVRYGDVTALMNPTYDENGNLVSVTARYNNGTYNHTFIYNEAGQRLAGQLDAYHEHERRNYAYTYDEAGRLIQRVRTYHSGWDYVQTITYTYDENGYLTSETQVYTRGGKYQYTVTYAYTNDEQGRPVSAVRTTDEENYSYASEVITFTYEDLYFYNAEG